MAFWFGRKSVPERHPFMPAWLTGDGESKGFARGYQAQLDEVYRRNPVGLRAVRLVSGLVGGLPLFGPSTGSGQAAVELLKSGGLLERAAANLLLHGNAYVRLAVDAHDRPAALHLMRPERVSVATGADGWPSAYLYRAGGQAVRIDKEDALGRRQVAHLKALSPADDHNEALHRIDMLLCPVVEDATLATPPSNPAIGACYLVAPGATGAWAGKDGMLAGFTDGGWRFIAPIEGTRVLDLASGKTILRRGGTWETGIVRAQEYQVAGVTVVSQQQAAIADPTGGGVIDAQCRTAVAAILSALRTNGLIS
jgi:hypothetical protein